MKKLRLLLCIMFMGEISFAQQTILRNLAENAPLQDWMMTGTVQGIPVWGSYLGHNIYGDEAFGEKYFIEGSAQVVGVIAHHRGHASGSNNDAWYRIHQVANNGLPGNVLGGKKIRLSEIDRSGEPFVVMFDNPVNVNQSFFVIWDLDDYSHGTQAGDTLWLLAGQEGSRPASDHNVFGRNVVRWHDHGPVPAWKDFFTQNFSPYSIFFAIYPIIQQNPLSIYEQIETSTFLYYPQPCIDILNLQFMAPHSGEYQIEILGTDGKKYAAYIQNLQAGEQTIQINTAMVPVGNFIAIIRHGSFQQARLLQKH